MVAVSTPVQELRDVLGAMQDGDLTLPMKRNYEGTWDELKQAANNMLKKLVAGGDRRERRCPGPGQRL
jgi:methyl-accepting chemotaxis protein